LTDISIVDIALIGVIVLIAAAFYSLAARSISKVIRQEVRSKEVEGLFKNLGMKGNLIDFNKFTDEGFTRFRQILYDLNQYKNPVAVGGVGGRLGQALAALQAANAVSKPQQQQTETVVAEAGVKVS
jgi:hypothetical protein